MTEASPKLQRIKDRIAQLSKIDAAELFTPEELDRRKQMFSRKSIINYQIAQSQDVLVSSHFEKNKNKSLKSAKPIFALNTDFFRSSPLNRNDNKEIMIQQELDQREQNPRNENEIFVNQNDTKVVQMKSSKVESQFNFIKLNPISSGQQIKPEQTKPFPGNSMATNIFNMSQPIANLFNNSSASTSQSIFNLRTSISSSSVPVLFTNTNSLFHNINSLKTGKISQGASKDNGGQLKSEQRQLLHSEEQKPHDITINQNSQIKSTPFASALKQKTTQNDPPETKQQSKLNQLQNISQFPFNQLSSNQGNTPSPISSIFNKPQNGNTLFGKPKETNSVPVQSLCTVNLGIFNNNKNTLNNNSSSELVSTLAPVQSASSNKQKSTFGASFFGQSNTLTTPLFGFSAATPSDSVLKPSLINTQKSLFDNSQSKLSFNNPQPPQNKSLFAIPLNLKDTKEALIQGQRAQPSKLINDRPFDKIKLNTNPPSPTIAVQSNIEAINQTNQIQSNISPTNKQQISNQQLLHKSEAQPNTKSFLSQKLNLFTNQNNDSSQVTKPISQVLKKQVTLTAIGPGGKKIDVPTTSSFFLMPQKPNLFGQLASGPSLFNSSPKNTPNFFTSGQPTQGGLFSSLSGGSIFGKQQLFSGLPPQSNNVGLFGNMQTSIFNVNNKQSIPEGEGNQEEEQEEDDGPIIAQDNANPQLSTGSYDYIQTDVTFKEVANKFRLNSKDIIENVVVSLQKFSDKPDKYIYVRMSNKCIAFTGKIIPKVTQIRCLNNTTKNVQIKKILLIDEKISKPQLVLLKIQFKDENKGDKLIKEVSKVLNDQHS